VIGVSLAFSYYVENFGSYNKTYGSIGAVIVLLLWMYLVGFLILVGGEMNSEIEHASASGKDPGDKQLN
jgi:membrane protein